MTLAVYWFTILRSFESARTRLWVRFASVVAALIVTVGVMIAPVRIGSHFPNVFVQWIRCFAIFVTAWVLYSIPVVVALFATGAHKPGRRRVLKTAATAGHFGAARPRRSRVHPPGRTDVSGGRDLHPGASSRPERIAAGPTQRHPLSPFVSESLLARAVDMANETKAHIAFVTGDLISRVGDPLDLCIQHLSRLRSDAGTIGCLGNHEIYAGAQDYTTVEGAKVGMRFLEKGIANPAIWRFDFESGRRRLPATRQKYLVGAEDLSFLARRTSCFPTILMFFPWLPHKGFDLTIAGHTHGGQVNFEILEQRCQYCPLFYALCLWAL